MGRTIPRDVWEIVQGTTPDIDTQRERYTSDPKTILLALAVQSLVEGEPGAGLAIEVEAPMYRGAVSFADDAEAST